MSARAVSSLDDPAVASILGPEQSLQDSLHQKLLLSERRHVVANDYSSRENSDESVTKWLDHNVDVTIVDLLAIVILAVDCAQNIDEKGGNEEQIVEKYLLLLFLQTLQLLHLHLQFDENDRGHNEHDQDNYTLQNIVNLLSPVQVNQRWNQD